MQLYDCLSEFPPPEKWSGFTHMIPLESRDHRRHVSVTLATQKSSGVHLNHMYEQTCTHMHRLVCMYTYNTHMMSALPL